MSHSLIEHRCNESRGGGTLRHRHSRSCRVQEDEFRSPNQEFIEYFLCFILRKIAFVFYIVYTIIDTILHAISNSIREARHDHEGKTCCRSRTRTETEDTVLSSAPILTESPKFWYKGEFRKEEGDYGHFTFIE